MDHSAVTDGAERIRYQNPAFPLRAVRGNENTLPLCHWHDDVELVLVTRGSLAYRVNNQEVTVREGDAIFVNARQMHYGSSPEGSCEYLCVSFRPELLCINAEIGSRFVFPVVTNQGIPWLLLRQDVISHKLLLTSIRKIAELSIAGHELSILSKLFEFWHGLYEAAQTERHAAFDGSAQALRSMLEYIRTHYSERISLEKIAQAGGVCRSKCCQIFRKFMPHSPNDYLNYFRLQKAAELLKTTNASIREIADACGFKSASYFAEVFLQNMGCSPTNYRKK